jgi:hypothetical protein
MKPITKMSLRELLKYRAKLRASVGRRQVEDLFRGVMNDDPRLLERLHSVEDEIKRRGGAELHREAARKLLGDYKAHQEGTGSEPRSAPEQRQSGDLPNLEQKEKHGGPRRNDPEVAKRAALVRSNLSISAEEMCEIFDRQKVPLPVKYQAAGFGTWSQAYKNPAYRSRIHTLISKDRQRN